MSLPLPLAPGTLKKSTLRSLAIIIDRPTAFLLIVAIFFSGVLITLPQSVQATVSQEKPVSSAPPEPFIIHSPAVTSVVGSTIANFVSTIASFFRPRAVPDGLTGLRIGSQPSAQPLRVERPTLESGSNVDQSENSLAPPFSVPAAVVDFDFDGDGRADYGRWHSANFQYKVTKSGSSGYDTFTIGNSSSARVAPGDFDGDGKTDAGVFSAGTWKYKTSPTASETSVTLGQSGDIPAAGDYDGDGKTDQAVFRPSTGTWLVRISSGGSCPSGYSGTAPNCSVGFGASGDLPVPGDYDGDSRSDPAVFRAGTWYVLGSQAGYYGIQWGLTSDIPVPANYDTDSMTDMAVFRPSSGTWYVLTSSSPGNYFSANWGNWGDQPTPADYDGDGKADLCIWRPSTGVWWMLRSSNGTYETVALGVNGDFAVPSAYLRQSGADVESDDLATARLSPRNATGGTDLYSQNFSWSPGLVSLPGRSGLDLNIGLSYNSLIWTKVGDAMVFDGDYSNVSPGFRLGFPVIEPVYYDGTKQKYAYMMVAPSGARVEFRQTTVSNIYETADSSYTQLVTSGASDPNDPVDSITIKVTTTDGTQMTYSWNYGEFRCTQIKDRNGNYISASYDGNGRLETITDTLGRVVTVNYSSAGPSSITQTWKDNNGKDSDTTHTWATFTYTDTDGGTGHAPSINTNFGSLSVVGPPNGVSIKVLQKITFPDDSFTTFSYNNYAQVTKVQNYAPDNHELNRVRLSDMESVTGTQSDCPRFTETKTFAENFNGGSELTFNNTAPASGSYSLPGSLTESGYVVDSWMTGHPDNLRTKLYFGSSGWKEGLPLATEDCLTTSSACSDRKRWTWTNWTQDNTSLAYTLNPRVIETRVGDGTNTKRTTIDYWQEENSTVAIYGLVKNVGVWDADLTSLLKQTYTTYNMDSAYVSRRIIGLPAMTELYGADPNAWALQSKVTYGYDQNGYAGSGQGVSPTMHDDTNYGTSFTYRGNLTSTTRWDILNSNASVASSVSYNTAGSPITQTDPRGRVTRIGYADVWNDSITRSTYAYPTTLTDAAGSSLGDTDHSSFVTYRYDTGANVQATSPAPAGNTYGKTSKRVFDSVGRLQRNSIYINTSEYSYVRYEYPTSGVQSKTYSTIVDKDSDGADANDEVLSESFTDGAGRVRQSRVPHTFNTNGTTASWAATITEYDILGRVARQSVPTEVNSSWAAAGDDAARGFLWTAQKYDWKGRVIRKINTDGDPNASENDSDVLISYDGCGCAGGQVTTIQTEQVPIPDTTSYARRKQKVFEDILGRQYKTESYEWNGSTVYSTVVNTFNGRDQETQTRKYAGSTSATTYQDTIATFDGYGRLASSHKPEQRDSSDNLKYTTYTYNSDDSIHTVTDGRGVVTTYTYGYTDDSSSSEKNGHLTKIAYTVPSGSGILDPSDITYSFDALGNRTQMNDDAGSVDFAYDSLSRLTSETRHFSDSLSNAPIVDSVQAFRLSYTYTLTGQIKTYTDPYGQQITRAFDRRGRMTDISGSSFGGVTSYAATAKYRSWGGLKETNYGSGIHLGLTYNNRLLAEGYNLQDASDAEIINKTYSYYTDGKLKYLHDLIDQRFDRLNTYNNVGHIETGKSGAEANGETVNPEDQNFHLPYRQSYGFDAFGHLTDSTSRHWGVTSWNGQSFNQSFSYANNRNPNWVYDADGRNTDSYSGSVGLFSVFNAAGKASTGAGYSFTTSTFDGNGLEVKRESERYDPETDTNVAQPTKYFVRSSVMGGRVVSEVLADGKKHRTFIKGLGNETAVQQAYASETASLDEQVLFEFSDSSGMSYRTTDKDGIEAAEGDGGEGSPIELDPLGGSVGTFTPYGLLGGGDWHPTRTGLVQPYNVYESNGPNFTSLYALYGSRTADLPGFGTNWGSFADFGENQYLEGVNLALAEAQNRRDRERAAADAAAALGTTPADHAAEDAAATSTPPQDGSSGDPSTGSTADGGWVDQSTSTVNLETNTVTVHFGFGSDADPLTSTLLMPGGGAIEMVDFAILRRQTPKPRPIWCNEDVIKAMKTAWSQSGNAGMQRTSGSTGVEAGFNLNGTPDNYKIDSAYTNEIGKMSMKINLGGSWPTFANFHIHPGLGSSGEPSTPDNNYEGNGKGDTGMADDVYRGLYKQAIQIYVMSWKGLSMYDPETKTTTKLVEGTGFLKGEGCQR